MRSPVTGGRKNDAADAEALWKPVTRRARGVDGASAGLHDDCPGAPGKRKSQHSNALRIYAAVTRFVFVVSLRCGCCRGPERSREQTKVRARGEVPGPRFSRLIWKELERILCGRTLQAQGRFGSRQTSVGL